MSAKSDMGTTSLIRLTIVQIDDVVRAAIRSGDYVTAAQALQTKAGLLGLLLASEEPV